MRAKINSRSVEALTLPKGKTREVMWDTSISGFGCLVLPSGVKSFIVQYRRNGRSHRVSLGLYGRITPEMARSEAKKLLGAVETGSDPIADRQAARQAAREARTFKDIADEFMRTHVETKRKSRTAEEYRRILNLHILPAIGSLGMREVGKSHVSRLHGSMSAVPYEANRTRALISTIWNWAEGRDEVTGTNPCHRLERYKEQPRERYLSNDELALLGDALREVKIDPYAVAAIKLLILTGARLREVLHARWEHVDIERGTLFLPDSKTGKKTIYLGAAALEILMGLPRLDDNPHIIPGAIPGRPRYGLHSLWKVVIEAAGLEGVRIHDLRHSFASVGAGANMGLPILGKLLGHAQAATTARYAHLDSDPLHAAVNTIGATISAAMGDGNSSADVVPMKRIKR